MGTEEKLVPAYRFFFAVLVGPSAPETPHSVFPASFPHFYFFSSLSSNSIHPLSTQVALIYLLSLQLDCIFEMLTQIDYGINLVLKNNSFYERKQSTKYLAFTLILSAKAHKHHHKINILYSIQWNFEFVNESA